MELQEYSLQMKVANRHVKNLFPLPTLSGIIEVLNERKKPGNSFCFSKLIVIFL